MTFVSGAPIPGLTAARTRLTNGQRQPDDWYRTPPRVTQALLDREPFAGPVWDPCCGDGAMARVVEAAGHPVIASDLIDRGYGTAGVDFLLEQSPRTRTAIINPPFKLADEFTLHALRLGVQKLAVLQRLAWLEGMARHKALWSPHPPIRVWVFSGRAALWRGDDPDPRDVGGVMALAWYVWDDSTPRAPSIGWIA